MKKYGSIDYVKRFAQKIVRDSWKDVDKLLPASEAKKKLKGFAQFLIERKI
jgi:geranylgeranyl pyrophosphate synthase